MRHLKPTKHQPVHFQHRPAHQDCSRCLLGITSRLRTKVACSEGTNEWYDIVAVCRLQGLFEHVACCATIKADMQVPHTQKLICRENGPTYVLRFTTLQAGGIIDWWRRRCGWDYTRQQRSQQATSSLTIRTGSSPPVLVRWPLFCSAMPPRPVAQPCRVLSSHLWHCRETVGC
jgi:hypothetical protein